MSQVEKRGQAQIFPDGDVQQVTEATEIIEPGPFSEGARQMGICNSCRYCEGYCAVFPAMERRLEFHGTDLNYLANLCHGCAECYCACQ